VRDLRQRLAERVAVVSGRSLDEIDRILEGAAPAAADPDPFREPAQAPFVGARPIFVRDDLTDEDGFAAASELGGFGVKVGRGAITAARYSLPDVAAVLHWLEGMKWDA
jgi:trehalose 6-phosphate phosphatase